MEKLRHLSKQLTEQLAQKSAALDKERRDLAEQQAKLTEQLEIMKREKVLSEQRAQKEHQLLSQVTHDKVVLELERERTDEREFNTQLVHKLELAARTSGAVGGTRSRSGSNAGIPLSPSLSGPIGASGSNSPTRKEPMPASSSGSRTPQLKLNLISACPSLPALWPLTHAGGHRHWRASLSSPRSLSSELTSRVGCSLAPRARAPHDLASLDRHGAAPAGRQFAARQFAARATLEHRKEWQGAAAGVGVAAEVERAALEPATVSAA